jgi:outer membrane immunogenic protein
VHLLIIGWRVVCQIQMRNFSMSSLYRYYIAAFLTLPTVAQAQDADRSPFAGPHLTVEAVRDSNEAEQPGSLKSAKGKDRSGIAVRGAAGYDVALGGVGVIGVEAGIGTGGKTINQRSLAAVGRYRVNPGFTYDITARAGFAPTSNILIYGRGGYRWLETEQSITGQVTGNRNFKRTEKGVTYGAGLEFAVSENLSLRGEFNRTKYSKDLRQNKISLGASIRF